MKPDRLLVPDDVINKQEYLKWIAFKKNPILTNPYYTTSEGEEINIASLPHRLVQKIKHLSPKEQEIVFEMKTLWNKANMKCNEAKSMAYGKKGKGKRTNSIAVLTDLEADIIELLGRLFTTKEVIEILAKDYDTIVDSNAIMEIRRKFVNEIERKKEEFKNSVTDVRLFNKRPRLEELAWMYSKMKNRYTQLNTNESYMMLLRTLEQIRKESEGDVLNIKGSIEMNVELEIQQQIQIEMLRTLNLKEVVIGRVAARMNYDTTKLINSLHNSYYSKFVTISGDFDPNAQMSFPSNQNYDFNKIQKESAVDAEIVTPEPITETEKMNGDMVKQLFLKNIKDRKKDLENRRDSIAVNVKEESDE